MSWVSAGKWAVEAIWHGSGIPHSIWFIGLICILLVIDNGLLLDCVLFLIRQVWQQKDRLQWAKVRFQIRGRGSPGLGLETKSWRIHSSGRSI